MKQALRVDPPPAAAELPDTQFEARDRLVMEHIGLVKAVASRLASRLPPQVETSDLISVGTLGLVNAAGRFDPSLGVPFDAFARRRIHGAMLDSLREMDWAPRPLRKMRRDVDGAIAKLRSQLGREPEANEIASDLQVSSSEYDRMLDQLRSAELATIRQASVDADGQSVLEIAIDPAEGPYARVERLQVKALLAKAITQLPERERQILALYHEQGLTLAEIAQVIGVGESRVSQLRSQAIARLRSILAGTVLKPAGDRERAERAKAR